MRVILVLLAVLLASTVNAQTVAVPNQVEAMVIPPGADAATATPIANQVTSISASDTNCGLTSEPSAGPVPLVNPTRIYFQDPFTAGRFCRTTMPSGVPPGNNYQAVLRFIAPSCVVNNSTVTPCPSARSTIGTPLFNIIAIVNPPDVPQNLHVRP